jgi:hypothetical protein
LASLSFTFGYENPKPFIKPRSTRSSFRCTQQLQHTFLKLWCRRASPTFPKDKDKHCVGKQEVSTPEDQLACNLPKLNQPFCFLCLRGCAKVNINIISFKGCTTTIRHHY